MTCRFVATSLVGFVQQVAVCLVGRGYWFYVQGHVPQGNDPAKVDEKLIRRYHANQSKWTRLRRKKAGYANIVYVRYRSHFLLLATHGKSDFFTEEAAVIRDARRVPIKIGGYAIGYRGRHVSVRIEQKFYLSLKAQLLSRATVLSTEAMTREFTRLLRFEPYAGVRTQCSSLLRAVNRQRALAGREPVPKSCLRTYRRVVKPFGPEDPNPGEPTEPSEEESPGMSASAAGRNGKPGVVD